MVKSHLTYQLIMHVDENLIVSIGEGAKRISQRRQFYLIKQGIRFIGCNTLDK